MRKKRDEKEKEGLQESEAPQEINRRIPEKYFPLLFALDVRRFITLYCFFIFSLCRSAFVPKTMAKQFPIKYWPLSMIGRRCLGRGGSRVGVTSSRRLLSGQVFVCNRGVYTRRIVFRVLTEILPRIWRWRMTRSSPAEKKLQRSQVRGNLFGSPKIMQINQSNASEHLRAFYPPFVVAESRK